MVVNAYTQRMRASGAKDDRAELQKVLDALREGDVFVVYKLDRLARSTKKLIEVYEQLTKLGVELVSICDVWIQQHLLEEQCSR